MIFRFFCVTVTVPLPSRDRPVTVPLQTVPSRDHDRDNERYRYRDHERYRYRDHDRYRDRYRDRDRDRVININFVKMDLIVE